MITPITTPSGTTDIQGVIARLHLAQKIVLIPTWKRSIGSFLQVQDIDSHGALTLESMPRMVGEETEEPTQPGVDVVLLMTITLITIATGLVDDTDVCFPCFLGEFPGD